MAILSKNYLEIGLSSAQIAANLAKFGPNEIQEKREYTAFKIFFAQFTSFLIIILLIAGSISIFLGELIDGLAIFAIVVINAMIGFFQEYKAENAVKALRNLVIQKTVVIRDKQQIEIPISEVVPDDIVILSEGEKIPADMELIEAFSLKVDESILTGESVSVDKKVHGKLFKGTMITTGHAKARVLTTGMNTEFGKIVDLLSKQEKTRSPLTLQLDDLSKKIGLAVLVLIVILFILGYIRGIPTIEMLMICVALGVSAIPEGMPIIVTLTLSMGVQILAKKNAIVRKMNSIETLGATTVICSDKTGTLTLNEMTVKRINTGFKETEVPGIGYSFKEKITLNSPEEKKLLEICENCNNAFVGKNILGDPTEIALKILARKANYVKTYKELDELTFSSERKMMSSLHELKNHKEVMSKGAFEEIIKRCTHIAVDGKIREISKSDINKYQKIADTYAEQALRVLGFAFKPYKNKFDENDLTFVGLVGMIDPPRKSVKASILAAQRAGIKVKIITGDNAITARAVGKSVGLKVSKIATGEQIDKLTNEELKKLIYETDIFARTNPNHKYRIVDILKKSDEVVAVTGDGVNDAPALKHADVGVAMGIKGTEATKEVADIVLKDDNFTTIVKTIEEGRRIYQNILSFIKYMLAANFDDLMVVGIITVAGYPLPVLPLQILWVNIATDALPALALGQSPASHDLMSDKPHPKKENIFKKFLGFISVAVIIQIVISILLYFYGLETDKSIGIDTSNLSLPSHARTLIFTQIVMFELFFAFVCKNEKFKDIKKLFANKALNRAVVISFLLQLFTIYAPFMQKIFKTVPLNLHEWGLILLAGLSSFLVPAITYLLRKSPQTNKL